MIQTQDFKNIAVQADLKCKHCQCDITAVGAKIGIEVAVQTEWGQIDAGLGRVYRSEENVPRGEGKGCVVALAQGISISNGDDLRPFGGTCSSHPCDPNCKYASNCMAGLTDASSSQRRVWASMPEAACVSVDSYSLKEGGGDGERQSAKMGWRKSTNRTLQRRKTSYSRSGRRKDHNRVTRDKEKLWNEEESDHEPLPESLREDCSNESSMTNEEVIKSQKKKNLKRKMPLKSKSTSSKRRLVQKTNYVHAGLYSDFYKTNPKSLQSDRMGPMKVFPRPVHYGRHLMEIEEDFLLPYDVWISRDNTKAQNPSLIYKKIKNNIYVDARPVCRDFEPSQCNCQPPNDPSEQGCLDNCLNRMVYTECSPNLCACGDRCGNQRIQKHQAFMGLREFQTENRGYGVRATRPITAGQFIMEYVGEVVSEQEFRRRMTDLYSGMEHHYCLSLDGGTVIDGYKCGNVSRLINHSCSPNCEMQKWNVNGVPRIGLFALRDIGVKEELTYDYNFHAYNVNAQQECKCGSDNCRKVVGGRGQKETPGTEKPKGAKVGFVMSYHRKNRSQILREYASTSGYSGMPLMRERKLIDRKHLLLLRNLNRVRRVVGLGEEALEKDSGSKVEDPAKKAEVFKTQFTAINTSRSVRTRQLTKAEDNDIILRMSFLAQVFMQVFNDIINCKDEFGNVTLKPSYHLPSKKKFPMLYGLVPDPVDLSMIERNISSGKYSSCLSFHEDFMKFFSVAEKIGSDGTSLELMKSQYFSSMKNARSFLESIGDVLPQDLKSLPPSPAPSSPLPFSPPPSSLRSNVSTVASSPMSVTLTSALYTYRQLLSPSSEVGVQANREPVFEFEEQSGNGKPDDIIRCICGLYLDEGVMLQCENCQTWQHQVCMGANEDEEDYLCHMCGKRKVSKEVVLMTQPKDCEVDCLYYMTLMRGDLQLRVGEVVYLLDEEDLLASLTSVSSLPPMSSLDEFSDIQLAEAYERLCCAVDKLDLFKIEHLWVDGKGDRLMHGHFYLRPREIYHDVGQKFYEREVLKAPSLGGTFPVACAVAPCCVMDVGSYVTGRPVGFKERDVYVCEFRVDKNRRTVKKPLRFSCPLNKSRFCFNRFAGKVSFKRTYEPHNMTQVKTKPSSSGKSKRKSPSNQPSTEAGVKVEEDDDEVKIDCIHDDDDDDDEEVFCQTKRKKKEPDLETRCFKLENIIVKIREAIEEKKEEDDETEGDL